MKNFKKHILSLLVLAFVFSALTGCSIAPEISESAVTFHCNNGEENVVRKTDLLGRVALPEVEREDYSFVGWYLDEGLTLPFGSGEIIYSDTHLYARWIPDYEKIGENVVREALLSNVLIKATDYEASFGLYVPTGASSGSGVIYKHSRGKYYVLTNCHVTTGEGEKTTYKITDAYGNVYDATLAASDVAYDLAVLVFSAEEELKTVKIDSRTPSEAELVVSMGAPGGVCNSYTFGEVMNYKSVEVSPSEAHISNVKFPVIWHTAYSSQGSSGGALLGADLELLGVNFATATSEGEFAYGLAIPAEKILEFLTAYSLA